MASIAQSSKEVRLIYALKCHHSLLLFDLNMPFDKAWLNGIGGFKGKSNWFHDRDDVNGTALYKCKLRKMFLPFVECESSVVLKTVNRVPSSFKKSFSAGDGVSVANKCHRSSML